jgi:hypothetical protein
MSSPSSSASTPLDSSADAYWHACLGDAYDALSPAQQADAVAYCGRLGADAVRRMRLYETDHAILALAIDPALCFEWTLTPARDADALSATGYARWEELMEAGSMATDPRFRQWQTGVADALIAVTTLTDARAALLADALGCLPCDVDILGCSTAGRTLMQFQGRAYLPVWQAEARSIVQEHVREFPADVAEHDPALLAEHLGLPTIAAAWLTLISTLSEADAHDTVRALVGEGADDLAERVVTAGTDWAPYLSGPVGEDTVLRTIGGAVIVEVLSLNEDAIEAPTSDTPRTDDDDRDEEDEDADDEAAHP